MKRLWAILLVALAVPVSVQGEEQPLASRVQSLGLFKNGLAVVERVAEAPGPGVYRLEELPVPVHGTFWIESDARVVARMTRRLVDVPLAKTLRSDFQESLAGHEVVVYFTVAGMPAAEGRVLAVEPGAEMRTWDRGYESYDPYGWSARMARSAIEVPTEPMLLLQTEAGPLYVRRALVAAIQVKGKTESARVERPVMLLEIPVSASPSPSTKKATPPAAGPATIVIRYLAKGMAWAPGYRVDLRTPTRLALRQQAVLKNELESFAGAEVRLISGFPHMAFGHIESPLSLSTTWSQFFQQLGQEPARGRRGQPVVMQQAVAYNAAQPESDLDLSAEPAGEGVDLHYQPIGQQTLAMGDALSLETAAGEADYTRIVDWLIPDTRDEWGRPVNRSDPSERETPQDDLWDAVRFRNPLAFPMTTAPAVIMTGDRFLGQQTSYWTNTGEATTLRVTKALSIRARSTEQEVQGDRKEVNYGGRNCWQVTVAGELRANNHRREPVTLVVRRRFTGELVSASGEPEKTILEQGAWSLNRRHQLTWTVVLPPGEEFQQTYRYTVLWWR